MEDLDLRRGASPPRHLGTATHGIVESMFDDEPSTTTVTSRDGTRIGVVEHGRPQRSSDRPSVLFLPALGVPVGYDADMLAQWSRAGRHIVAVELRGMPLTPVANIRRQRFGYATIIREDLPAIVDSGVFADSGRYVAVGHSLGGQLALLASAAGTIGPLATVAIASGTSSPAAQTTIVGRSKRRGQVAFASATSAALGYWPGDRLGFGGRQPRALMRDWCREGRTGLYRLHGDDTDYEAALRTMELPVLMLSLDGDSVITEPAFEHLAKRLPAHVERSHLGSTRSGGFDHVRWARAEPQPIIDATEN